MPTIKAFAEKFQMEYGYEPDHNGLKGYSAMYNKNGNLDRESFMTKVVNGKQQVVATLPPASAK